MKRVYKLVCLLLVVLLISGVVAVSNFSVLATEV